MELHLMKLLYEVYGYYQDTPTKTLPASSKELIYEQFLDLVRQYYKEQHDMAFYANQLHITPKYLAAAVRAVSGKTAKAWIDGYLVLEARLLLKQTDMSVQQVAYRLHFANLSGFGKYFKRQTGQSPISYKQNN